MKAILTVCLCLALGAQLFAGGPSESATQRLLRRASPAVVKVTAERGRQYVASGVIFASGLLVTSHKLAGCGSGTVRLETASGNSHRATLLASDDTMAVALYQVAEPAADLRPLPLAKEVNTGDKVLLVSAFYDRFPAVFEGLVSHAATDALLLNAPSVPGSLGGAIINLEGELVGIIRGSLAFARSPDFVLRGTGADVALKAERLEQPSLCYGIPARSLAQTLPYLKDHGYMPRPWLGISVQLNGNAITVTDVRFGSPAAVAGLQQGDIIGPWDQAFPYTVAGLMRYVADRQPGERIVLPITRQKLNLDIEVRLSACSAEDTRLFQSEPPVVPECEQNSLYTGSASPWPSTFVVHMNLAGRLGLELMELNQPLAIKLGATDGYGLLVSRVLNASPAQQAGIEVGDILTSVAGSRADSLSALRLALQKKHSGTLRLDIIRERVKRRLELKRPAPAMDGGRQHDEHLRSLFKQWNHWLPDWLHGNGKKPQPAPNRRGIV